MENLNHLHLEWLLIWKHCHHFVNRFWLFCSFFFSSHHLSLWIDDFLMILFSLFTYSLWVFLCDYREAYIKHVMFITVYFKLTALLHLHKKFYTFPCLPHFMFLVPQFISFYIVYPHNINEQILFPTVLSFNLHTRVQWDLHIFQFQNFCSVTFYYFYLFVELLVFHDCFPVFIDLSPFPWISLSFLKITIFDGFSLSNFYFFGIIYWRIFVFFRRCQVLIFVY